MRSDELGAYDRPSIEFDLHDREGRCRLFASVSMNDCDRTDPSSRITLAVHVFFTERAAALAGKGLTRNREELATLAGSAAELPAHREYQGWSNSTREMKWGAFISVLFPMCGPSRYKT